MAEPERKRGGLPPRLTLLLVVAAFVAPILIAWWFAFVSPPESSARLNRGVLIQPPLDARAERVLAPLGAIELGPGEWAMLAYTAGACGTDCNATLGMLRTIRQVLGHDGTRVRIAALADEAGATDVGDAVELIVDAPARARVAAGVSAGGGPAAAASGVVFLDWRGQLMLYFADASQPGDIKKDLKRLLRGSKIN
ncbi:MAG: hypothetical protein ACU85V_03265 [Gammaproteobacteria bacterium]